MHESQTTIETNPFFQTIKSLKETDAKRTSNSINYKLLEIMFCSPFNSFQKEYSKIQFSGLILLSFAKADARKEQAQDVQQVRSHQGLISVVYQSK